MNKKIELSNLEYALKRYGSELQNNQLIIGIDYLSIDDSGADLVVYDATQIDGFKIESYQELVEYCNEHFATEEDFEIDRYTLIKA